MSDLATLEAAIQTALSDTCVVDSCSREVYIPDELSIAGVESDDGTHVLKISVPRYPEEDIDLNTFVPYVNFINCNSEMASFKFTHDLITAGTDTVTLHWPISRMVTAKAGTVRFSLCFRLCNADDVIVKEWNSTIAALTVLDGLEAEELDNTIKYDPIAVQVAQAKAYAEQAASQAATIEGAIEAIQDIDISIVETAAKVTIIVTDKTGASKTVELQKNTVEASADVEALKEVVYGVDNTETITGSLTNGPITLHKGTDYTADTPKITITDLPAPPQAAAEWGENKRFRYVMGDAEGTETDKVAIIARKYRTVDGEYVYYGEAYFNIDSAAAYYTLPLYGGATYSFSKTTVVSNGLVRDMVAVKAELQALLSDLENGVYGSTGDSGGGLTEAQVRAICATYTHLTEVQVRAIAQEYASSGGTGLTDEQAGAIAANTSARHTHGNKSILDSITQEMVNNWNDESLTEDQVNAIIGREVTQAQYDAMTQAQKSSGIWWITDADQETAGGSLEWELTDSFTYSPPDGGEEFAEFELTNPILRGEKFVVICRGVKCEQATANYELDMLINGSRHTSTAFVTTVTPTTNYSFYRNFNCYGEFINLDGTSVLRLSTYHCASTYVIDRTREYNVGNSYTLERVYMDEDSHVWNGSTDAIRMLGLHTSTKTPITTAFTLDVYKYK